MNKFKQSPTIVHSAKSKEDDVLKNEFNNLIKEITNEVINSTISKSLSSTSETINKQTPLIDSATKLLTIETQKLQKTNIDTQSKLKLLNNNKIEAEMNKITKKLPSTNSFFLDQNELIKDIKKELMQNMGRLQNLEHLLNENEELLRIYDADIVKKVNILTVIGAVIIVLQLLSFL